MPGKQRPVQAPLIKQRRRARGGNPEHDRLTGSRRFAPGRFHECQRAEHIQFSIAAHDSGTVHAVGDYHHVNPGVRRLHIGYRQQRSSLSEGNQHLSVAQPLIAERRRPRDRHAEAYCAARGDGLALRMSCDGRRRGHVENETPATADRTTAVDPLKTVKSVPYGPTGAGPGKTSPI